LLAADAGLDAGLGRQPLECNKCNEFDEVDKVDEVNEINECDNIIFLIDSICTNANTVKLTFIQNYKIYKSNLIEHTQMQKIDWDTIKHNTKDECLCCFNKNMDACVVVDIKSILLFNLFKENTTKYAVLCLDCWMNNIFEKFDYSLVINYKNPIVNEFDQQIAEEIIPGVYKVLYQNSPILLVAENLGAYPSLTIPEVANLNLPIMCDVKIIIAGPPL
jgi:hypothetical protein